MKEREVLAQEYWRRIAAVPGVVHTARNPSGEPNAENLPAIQFIEGSDEVIKVSMRGGFPVYTRSLMIITEIFIVAASENSATKELGAFVELVKKEIYKGGNNLGRKGAQITETEAGRVLRPPIGQFAIGIGLVFEIIYIEEIAKLNP